VNGLQKREKAREQICPQTLQEGHILDMLLFSPSKTHPYSMTNLQNHENTSMPTVKSPSFEEIFIVAYGNIMS
jgi:hypothetical protein